MLLLPWQVASMDFWPITIQQAAVVAHRLRFSMVRVRGRVRGLVGGFQAGGWCGRYDFLAA